MEKHNLFKHVAQTTDNGLGLFVLCLLILVGLCLYRDYRKEKREHQRRGKVFDTDQEVGRGFGRGRN